MTGPTRWHDRADDSLFALLGEIPELIRNLVVAEIDAGKAWVAKTIKDGRAGALFFLVALFLLFWVIPLLLAFAIIGLSSWMPAWLASLIVFVVLLLGVALFAFLGILRFRKIGKSQNPVQTVAKDVTAVREVGDEF
jgi:protein-S-isoprenylcysteine O-methyltransferase Ste14